MDLSLEVPGEAESPSKAFLLTRFGTSNGKEYTSVILTNRTGTRWWVSKDKTSSFLVKNVAEASSRALHTALQTKSPEYGLHIQEIADSRENFTLEVTKRYDDLIGSTLIASIPFKVAGAERADTVFTNLRFELDQLRKSKRDLVEQSRRRQELIKKLKAQCDEGEKSRTLAKDELVASANELLESKRRRISSLLAENERLKQALARVSGGSAGAISAGRRLGAASAGGESGGATPPVRRVSDVGSRFDAEESPSRSNVQVDANEKVESDAESDALDGWRRDGLVSGRDAKQNPGQDGQSNIEGDAAAMALGASDPPLSEGIPRPTIRRNPKRRRRKRQVVPRRKRPTTQRQDSLPSLLGTPSPPIAGEKRKARAVDSNSKIRSVVMPRGKGLAHGDPMTRVVFLTKWPNVAL